MINNKVLKIQNLHIKDSTGYLLVEKLSFEVHDQEIVCVQGQSGVGKTITALAVMGLLPSSLKVSSGKIWLDDSLIYPDDSYIINQLRGKTVSMVFQEPATSFNPLCSMGDQIADSLRTHESELSTKEYRYRVEKSLAEIGFKNIKRIMNSFPHELSGGQLQRCLLASSLLADVKLLIADEPTSSLDDKSRDEVLEVITRLNKEHDMAVLIITHDSNVAARVSHRVIIWGDDEIVSPPKINFLNNSYSKKTPVHLKIQGKGETNTQSSVLRVEKLTKIYKKPGLSLFKKEIPDNYTLKKLSFSLQKKEILGITGPSGCGKTTLARCLLGLTPWNDGLIEINGQIVQPIIQPKRSAQLGIQMIWQHPLSALNPVMTVEEIIAENLHVQGINLIFEIDTCISTVLEQVELSETVRKKYPAELSGGQCQRVALASILVLHPKILIADEPVSYLDYKTKNAILQFLKKFRDDMEMSIIFMSHDIESMIQVCDRSIML